jgi:hypothetical protein
MRKSLIMTAMAIAAFAAIPSSTTLVGIGSLAAAISLLAPIPVEARTAILPGWRYPCGRNPRCFERAEARRLARLRARSASSAAP